MGWFNFLGNNTSDVSLGVIFPFSVRQADFIQEDILTTYSKILTDVIVRTQGIKEKYESTLWDNCVQDESSAGLITLLSEAMTKKSDLFLVYKASVNVLRKADAKEEATIRADYKSKGKSEAGVFISFKNYRRTTMLTIYSNFEYCILASLNKILNTAKSIQVKISGLRNGVSLSDSSVATAQAKAIALAIGQGNDILIDKDDEITSATPDTSSSEKSIAFLDAKRAFILDMPISYISGTQTGGIGSTGEADMRAVERGLKGYFHSIIKPVIKSLFGDNVEFRTQDFREVTSSLEVLKTFELTQGTELLSQESMIEILCRMFQIDESEELKRLASEKKDREAAQKKYLADQKNNTIEVDV